MVGTSTSWGRRIIRGLINFNRKENGLELFMQRHDDGGIPAVTPQRGACHGIIARVSSGRLASRLKKLELPVVNISSIELPKHKFPTVANDIEASAKLAAEHFLERGFRNFGFYSSAKAEHITRHRNAFIRRLDAMDRSCAVFHGTGLGDCKLLPIAEWLAALPKPVAILAWNGGDDIIEAARLAVLSIPDEVALVSSSDDFLCEAAAVPVSGIQADGELIGFTAGMLIARLLKGAAMPDESIHIPPRGIITRLSTETLAINDPAISKAIRLIRSHFARELTVDDLARTSGIARRALERRFHQCLGVAPAQYLQSIRLNHAKHLLTETRLRMPDIAEAAGFSSAEYLARVFRNHCGTSPLRYRKNHLFITDELTASEDI